VDVVERKLYPGGVTGGTVSLKCKDLAIINLEIGSTEEFNNVADSIEALSNIGMYIM